MKLRNLLSLGMVVCAGVAVQADPIFTEDFNNRQTKEPTEVAYYEFINQQEGDEWGLKDNALGIKNDEGTLCANQKWQRAIKFRNIPLLSGKIYRLNFDLTGSSKYSDETFTEVDTHVDVKLMQGDENADICILGADGTEQRRDYAPVKDGKYTTLFYYADEYNQRMKYDEQCSGKENYSPDKYFVCVNVYNPGVYTLDNVVLEESNAVEKLEFNGYNIRVTYGNNNNTNIKALAAASTDAKGRVIIDPTYARVKVDGIPVEVETIELQADGYLYIFVKDEIEAGKNVAVTFINPAEEEKHVALQGAWEGADVAFDDMTAEFSEDEALAAAVPFAYAAPELVSCTPENESFSIPVDIKEFTFTFDHVVDESLISAEMSNGESLSVSGVSDEGKTITFSRSGGDLDRGPYTITLKNVVTKDSQAPADEDPVLSFEAGKVKIAKTVYGEYQVNPLTGANGGIPDGWSVFVQAENWNGGTEWLGGSACRNINVNGTEGEQAALYLCDRDGWTYAKYGDKEGATLTLPAGNIEFGIIALGHEDPHRTVEFQLEDMNGNVVLKTTGTTQQNANANEFSTLKAAGSISATFENPQEQNFILKVHEPQGGFTACRLLGFQYRTFTMTDGEKVTTEKVATGSFTTNDCAPEHGSGWKVYRGDGRMRDPGANCSWGGNDWTGGGGPRIKTMSNKGMAGGGIYLGGGCYATFGEYALQTDHNGTVAGDLPEKTLDLNAAKYQFTYYIIGWKDNPENVKLEIFNYEDGIAGTPVYTRNDQVEVHCGSAGDGGPEAKKVNFFWNAPKEGKYILKFTSEGGNGEAETVLGNVTVESTVSLAAQYATMLDKALDPAKDELATAMSNDEYRGETRDALANMINEYTDPDYTTVGQYEEAMNNIDAMIKKMALRRSNIDAFPKCVEDISKGLEAAKGTKYENLEQYPIVEQAYNDFSTVYPVDLGDERLDEAVQTMKANGTLLTNMVNICSPLLTKQITGLISGIVSLDEPSINHPHVLAAGNAINDDQEVVKNLKTLFAAKVYAAMAAGDPFTQVDPDLLIETTTPIEASFLIRNAEFYCTQVVPAGSTNLNVEPDAFPGWDISVVSGSIKSSWDPNWGGAYPKPDKPVENCALKSPYGSGEYDVQQLINGIPVAKYNVSIAIGHDGTPNVEIDDETDHNCYGFCGEEQFKSQGNEGKFARDTKTTCLFENVAPQVESGALTGSILLGAHMQTCNFSQVDDAKLQMVGKVEGFDYAAAAKKLADEVVAVNEVAQSEKPAGDPVMVNYYDLNGAQVAVPQGIVVKVAVWANGYTEISKETK